MIVVEFLGPIQKEPLKLNIDNLNQLPKILSEDTEVSHWLESCAVAVNDTLTNKLELDLNDGDKISLLPPVCGG